MKRALCLLVAVVASLALCPSASARVDHSMSQHRAAQYYLHHACAANRAQATFVRQVWGRKKTLSYAEIERRLKAIHKASEKYSVAEHRLAKAMFNPPAAWPSNVAGLVERLAKVDVRATSILSDMASVGTARGWGRLWRQFNRLPWGYKAEDIRARLGLPLAGRGCKAA